MSTVYSEEVNDLIKIAESKSKVANGDSLISLIYSCEGTCTQNYSRKPGLEKKPPLKHKEGVGYEELNNQQTKLQLGSPQGTSV